MIRAHVSQDGTLFERNRVAILAMDEQDGFPHRRLVFVPGHDLESGLTTDRWVDVDSEDGQKLAHPYTLDVPRHVAKAVYDALGEVFAPKDPTPLASDRAYSDARQDIDRQHALIDKLVDAATRPPLVVNEKALASTHLDPR